MNHWIVSITSVSITQRDLLLTLSVFPTHGTCYFHGVVFMLLEIIKKVRLKFFDVHVISTLIIYFFKSFLHKSSHTISWIYYNIYHIYNMSPFLMRLNTIYLAYSDTLRMKIHLLEITNVLHITSVYISSVYLEYIFIYNNFLKVPWTRILKSKIKTLWNFDKSINTTAEIIMTWSSHLVH